ncbi:Ubiquitin-conjugating enzyme E2 7 [Acorus gramineus]|uniref:Ubiquitin-conjugating enzyme E2 7 n=1 Tax=Acorus gramineus TaxID=55184 RepID=A0AAV9ALK7_ACOGR|nr:Ubiquitin-conjugating enzyme E2 7 [Acorus gramineus]
MDGVIRKGICEAAYGLPLGALGLIFGKLKWEGVIMSFPPNYPDPAHPRFPSVRFTSEMWNVYPDVLACISILLAHGDDPNGYGLASLRWTSVHKYLQCFVGDVNARQHSTYEKQDIFLVVAAGIMTDWALGKHRWLKQV